MKKYLSLLFTCVIPFIAFAEPSKQILFLDLSITEEERVSIHQAIEKVFLHGKFALGPEVAQLETAVANYCQRKYAVGVGSGTEALFLSLRALNIGPGDEVITTSLSWIATAGAISMTGATPVFADIGEDLNIDPRSVEQLITSKTKAILPVHYTGKMCDMNALLEIAKKHNLYVIEDGAQAFGALYEGKPSGYFGDIGCFSMNSWKIFGSCGEAGMIVTDDEKIYQRLLFLRNNGIVNKETCVEHSLNFKMDTIQAAILLERLPKLNDKITRRREIASLYSRFLKLYVKTPEEQTNNKDIYYTYQIQTPQRDALKKFLEGRGIETKILHSILMSQQPVYVDSKKSTKHAEKIVKEILCLPAQDRLSDEEIKYIIDSVIEFFHTF